MKNSRPFTLVIIPAFNEGLRIASVIKGVKGHCPLAEVLVIDDGSKDETRLKAMESGARVVSHPYNLGYGAALQTGYKYALEKEVDELVQIDGDGQHDPFFITDLLTVIREENADITIGSRFLGAPKIESGQKAYQAPFLRKIRNEPFWSDRFTAHPAEGHGPHLWVSGDEPEGPPMDVE